LGGGGCEFESFDENVFHFYQARTCYCDDSIRQFEEENKDLQPEVITTTGGGVAKKGKGKKKNNKRKGGAAGGGGGKSKKKKKVASDGSKPHKFMNAFSSRMRRKRRSRKWSRLSTFLAVRTYPKS
jgi:hypothetical protein